MADFVPGKVLLGDHPLTGEPQYQYDFSAHPGMQDPALVGNTHILLMTGKLNGQITTTSGNTYDTSEDWIAVPVEDTDEVVLKTHEAALAAGLTTDPVPALGPVAQAAADFNAALAAAGQPPFVPPAPYVAPVDG